MNRILISATILSLCLWTAGCKNGGKDSEAGQKKQADKNMNTATANIEPTKGNTARGTVVFHQMGDKVHVVADIHGLKPNQKHAIHIHEGTECGEDGMAAKGHYNPENHEHGLPSAPNDKRHAGDLGNLQADGSGKAHHELTVDNISISGTKNPIVGRAIIVHADDDEGTQPVGNAGARIGCGIIKAGGGGHHADVHVHPADQTSSTLYQPKFDPAIRLSESGPWAMQGEFALAGEPTSPDLSRAITEVYQEAGVAYEAKRPASIKEGGARYTFVSSSPGISNVSASARVTISGATRPAKTGSAK